MSQSVASVTGTVAMPTTNWLVLAVTSGNLTAGTPVQIWTKNSPATSNQLWTLTSDGYLQSQAAPGVITVKNVGGYVARCTVTYKFDGQQQSQSSGNLLVGQIYSVPIPIGTTDIRVECEDETGVVTQPWKTILDKTYSTPSQKTINLTGTTVKPGFNEQ